MDMKSLTYSDVCVAYKNNRVTAKEIAEWFPLWCVGKAEYRFRDGVAEEFWNIPHHPNGGEWFNMFWINLCIKKSKNMGQS